MTLKFTLLLAVPPAVETTTFPLTAPFGATVLIFVSDQLETEAACPAKVTVPVTVPKPLPEIVTDAPIGALEGLKLLIFGRSTVNVIPLL